MRGKFWKYLILLFLYSVSAYLIEQNVSDIHGSNVELVGFIFYLYSLVFVFFVKDSWKQKALTFLPQVVLFPIGYVVSQRLISLFFFTGNGLNRGYSPLLIDLGFGERSIWVFFTLFCFLWFFTFYELSIFVINKIHNIKKRD